MVERLRIPGLALAAMLLAAGGPLFAQEAAEAPAPGKVVGTVAGAGPGDRARPLPHAWVALRDAPRSASALSDSTGRYRLDEVPAGLRRVRVEHLGYRPLELEVRVPANGTVRLDLELRPHPLALPGLTVRAEPVRPLREARPGARPDLAELDLRALASGPGFAGTDLGAAARELADRRDAEPTRVLLMRGSTADQKLVLLDGAPVHTPFHVGGLVPGFESSVLGSARHFVGGAPVRYDGGLSHVLDLATRPGRRDALHASASLDLLSGAVTAEGPLGESGSVLASGRLLHDAAARLATGKRSPYGYHDGLLRADVRAGEHHRISVTGFRNREEVRLALPPPAPSRRDPTASRAIAEPDRAAWGNDAVSLRYRGGWDRTNLEISLAGSRYRALLPLGGEEASLARARTDRLRGSAEVERRLDVWTVRVGAAAGAADHTAVAHTVEDDSVAAIESGGRVGLLALHAEAEGRVAPSLRLRGGVRLDHFPGAGGPRLAPRASLAWALTDQAVLTLAGGRFFQLPRGSELEVRVATDDPAGVAAGQALHAPAEATHLILGLDQSLSATLDLGLEAFVKGFRNLPGTGERPLRSSGVDLRVGRSGERAAGWFGYSLAWFWETGADEPGGTEPGRFAGRHLLTTGLEGTLDSGLGAALRGAYGDGLPYTSVPIFGGDDVTDGAARPHAEPTTTGTGRFEGADTRVPALDGFLRLDLEIFADREVTWGDRRARVRPYLRLLNALSRRDALFYYFEPWRSDELRALAERPLLPVLGIELEF